MLKKFVLTLLTLSALSSLYALEWKTNLEEAQKEAAKTGKLVFVNFTGSDWCIWCIRLKKEVFSQESFQKEAPKMFVFVELDFPRNKQQSEETKQYNRKLMEKYGVQGFPTILILDTKGKVLARTGYRRGGAEAYIKHLKELAQLKEVVEIFQKLSQGNFPQNDAEVEQLQKALEVLEKNQNYEQVSKSYPKAKIKAYQALIEKDPQNQKGWKLKFSKKLARHYAQTQQEKELDQLLAEIQKFDPKAHHDLTIELKELPRLLRSIKRGAKKEDFEKLAEDLKKLLEKKPSGEVSQQIYYYLGAIYFRVLQKHEEGKNFLKKAYEAAPNTPFGKQIAQILQRLNQK